MIPSVHIRHLVRLTKPGLTNKQGTVDVTAEHVTKAFEPGFYCGIVNGHQRKYHDHAVLKRWKVVREVDESGHTVDERIEEV